MSTAKRRRILGIIATDSTFERTEHRGRDAWLGKCLHCNAHLMVGLDGEPISRATIEHILPQTAGGTDALSNLGLACARCNHGKGRRHDPNYHRDARARELVERLLARRRARWREPDHGEDTQ
jgi:5-methylcytosine-specific restriction endonuclease McrA